MVNEADELPLAKVDDALWHVECHVDNGNFTVPRRICFVGQQGIVDHPGLGHRLLWIVKLGVVIVMAL